MAFELPPLPYDYNALEPHIDEQTMRLHHDKHHNTYVTNLNGAVEGTDLENRTVEEIISDLSSVPQDIRRTVRNNGGQHSNHTMFWEIMAPEGSGGGGQPTGDLADAINSSFGSFDALQEQWSAMSAPGSVFGSGWTWLVASPDGSLSVDCTPNGDSPLMQGRLPIIGIDLWEHSYYLKYQNARLEYVSAWWNVVNWEEADRRFGAARSA